LTSTLLSAQEGGKTSRVGVYIAGIVKVGAKVKAKVMGMAARGTTIMPQCWGGGEADLKTQLARRGGLYSRDALKDNRSCQVIRG
jgi:hypothetical protein